MYAVSVPFQKNRAARWWALETLRAEPEKEDQPGLPIYQNIALFTPLEDEFYSLPASEAGGFENAQTRMRPGLQTDIGGVSDTGEVPAGAFWPTAVHFFVNAVFRPEPLC